MDNQGNIEKLIENTVGCLQALKLNPSTDVTYKEVDGSIYTTITISCKDANGADVTLFKLSNVVPEPQKLRQEILNAESNITQQLSDIQTKKESIFAELDKVAPAEELEQALPEQPTKEKASNK